MPTPSRQGQREIEQILNLLQDNKAEYRLQACGGLYSDWFVGL